MHRYNVNIVVLLIVGTLDSREWYCSEAIAILTGCERSQFTGEGKVLRGEILNLIEEISIQNICTFGPSEGASMR